MCARRAPDAKLSRQRDVGGRHVARMEFQGKIGNDWRDSEPWWPPLPTPPEGAPNVVVIVLDDVGFAQLGCYGSDIETPFIDGRRRRGGAADQLPHHRAVLTDEGLPAHRAQPSSQRHGPRGRPCRRVSRLLGTATPRERLRLRNAAFHRLRHLRRRQVASEPRGRDQHGQLAGDLAPRARLRPLVRLPRRGDPPVRPGALPRQPRRATPTFGRTRATTSAPIWPTGP